MEDEEVLVVIRNYDGAVEPDVLRDMCLQLREMRNTRVISLNIVARHDSKRASDTDYLSGR